VSDLVHVTSPIHITPDVHVSRFDKPPKPGSVKAVISPEVTHLTNRLGNKVYDVSTALRKTGMTLPKGSHALYTPESKTLYIDSIPDDVEIAQAMFYSEPPPVEYTMDLRIVLKSAAREETLFEVKSVPLVEGRELKFNTSSRDSLRMIVAPQFDHFSYGFPAIDVGFNLQVRSGNDSISVTDSWLMHHLKPVEAMLGRLGDATLTLSIQTHTRQGRWGDDAESEKENKAAAIKEIQEALNKAK
jgi:hypothetical protein